VKLVIPTLKELDYRKRLLADSETMTYNKGFDEFKGYNKETGCIDFVESLWNEWYSRWVNNTPNRYYAYIIKTDDNIPVGEVALRYDEGQKGHCVNIIIEAKHTGNGYSEEALRLLIDVAFNELKAEKIYDDFPATRVSAEKLFKKIGFRRISSEVVELSKENYVNILNT
jgi:diamine N-acetyltransferase